MKPWPEKLERKSEGLEELVAVECKVLVQWYANRAWEGLHQLGTASMVGRQDQRDVRWTGLPEDSAQHRYNDRRWRVIDPKW